MGYNVTGRTAPGVVAGWGRKNHEERVGRMNVNSTRTRSTSTFLILLSLVAMLNASQTMVLCVGHDGHVAVEIAGHDHCRGEHASDSHCCPCTDIPIPVGPCTKHNVADKLVPGSVHLTASLSLLETTPADVGTVFASTSPLILPSFYTPLRSIVLQV